MRWRKSGKKEERKCKREEKDMKGNKDVEE